jgi:alginate O-acetyltransferase complex protein AlgI
MIRWPQPRLIFLIFASYVFYGFWDWRFCFLLSGSSLFNWMMGKLIYKSTDAWRKPMVTLAVVLNLGLLGFFKYCNFFLGSVNGILDFTKFSHEVPYADVVLPVGISFFTFHGISYVVDIYRRKIDQPASLVHVLFYVSFFPQLVAGPIVRASHFLPQIANPVDPQDVRARRAILLILGGLFKKVILATYISSIVDPVFFDPSQYGTWDLMFADYGYAAQIYCDFSAYTDIAIGVAALLGYRFPWNFNQPYRAMGLQDFWQRWHISLSSWLRDYLYISLGGNRFGELKRYRNLFLTMILGGLWHGASWNFVIWGALHGTFLVVEHALFKGNMKAALTKNWMKILATIVTFQFVCFTWVFFRSSDFWKSISYLEGLSRWHQSATLLTPSNIALLLIAMSLHFLPQNWIERMEYGTRRIPLILWGACAGIVVVGIDSLGPPGVAPFIYFQF